jgi:hypothetical protein
VNVKNINDFYQAKVAEIANKKACERKREDMIDGLLHTINYAQDHLPITIVSMHRFRENLFPHSPQKPFLSHEVACILGGVDGTPFYYWNGKLFVPQNRLEVVIPFVKEVSEKDISENVANGLLVNISRFVDSCKTPEVHACGFFIFRYLLPVDADKKQWKRGYIPISEQSLQKAIGTLLYREDLGKDLERAERIEVFYASRWTYIEKMPPSDDVATSRVLGRPTMTLAVRE